ncbi:MAG: SsrA-binding protein SmpB [Spirochaetia bacterium]|nr:SsrA-binding protein SmpB [Spirochaetia bacterium]
MKTPVKKTPVIENKKSRRNYEILETLEAGIVLTGSEVKSLRLGRAEITDAHAVPQKTELMLINLRIDPYENAGYVNHEETRSRKLLLHKKEIIKLISRIREKRLAVIPLKIYFNDRGKVKVLLGIGRGKKLSDQRQDERKQEAKREIERALKEANRK